MKKIKLLLGTLIATCVLLTNGLNVRAEELTRERVNSTADMNETYIVHITKNVTDIYDGAFSDLKNLKEFRVDEDNEYYASYNGCLYNKDFTTLICVPQNINNIHIHNNACGYLSHALDGLPQQKKDTALQYFSDTDNVSNISNVSNVSDVSDIKTNTDNISNNISVQQGTAAEPNRTSSTDFSQYVYTEGGRTYFKYTGSGESNIIIPDGVDTVMGFTANTFDFNNDITYIYFPSSVKRLADMNMFAKSENDFELYNCLYSCPNLQKVESDASSYKVDSKGVYRPMRNNDNLYVWLSNGKIPYNPDKYYSTGSVYNK